MSGPLPATGNPPGTASQPRLSGRWLLLARVVWLSVATVLIASFLLTRPLIFARLEQVHTLAADEVVSLRPQDLPVLAEWGLSPAAVAAYGTVLSGLVLLAWIAMGVLLFARQSAEPRALFFSFFLVLFGGGPAQALAVVQPIWWLPVTAYGFLDSSCLFLFVFVFPTGRFVPRWTRWVALASILVSLGDSFFPDSPLDLATWPGAISTLFQLVAFGGAIVAQVYRYWWRSTPLERQQTKWVVLALGILLLLIFASEPVLTGAATPFWVLLVLATVVQLAQLLIPVAIATSILRYRLWEIDSLINKALVYGSLTALLGAVYTGLIIGLESLAGLFGGTTAQNPVVLVISTLAVAALFFPVRKRLQNLIDRRFYRKKYDAAKTVEAFSASLRQETNLEQVQEQLIAVVQETMQSAHVSLWLRPPASRPQAWQPRASGMLTSAPHPQPAGSEPDARQQAPEGSRR